MTHASNTTEELDKYVCLICDAAFLLGAQERLLCPACGNHDEEAFAPAEQEEADGTNGGDGRQTFHQVPAKGKD